MKGLGFAGRIASYFINSKLTPILVAAALLLGIFAVTLTPREEEPQIVVPMLDVMVSYPGATAAEVENRVTTPMEQLLWEIPGVEYVYSIAKPGSNLTIVRFKVGQSAEDSLVKLYNKLMANYDRIPPGMSQPLVKMRSIDDVPVLALTLWSDKPGYDGYELRRVAAELAAELKKDEAVSEINIIGGQKRQLRIQPDPVRLQAYHLTWDRIGGAVAGANALLSSGNIQQQNREVKMETGRFLSSAADVEQIVVGVYDNRPVYLRQVADILDGPGEPDQYVFMDVGAGGALKGLSAAGPGPYEAVTLSLAKQAGANATVIAERALAKVERLRGGILPAGVQVTATRNYGDTAKEKSDELLEHMLIATVSVVILIALTLGWREAGVVGVAVPVTLALTLLISYLLGYTLNRVTLFALIFSIGILVDDAIVVVENIHRRFTLAGRADQETAVQAVDEVGNPTILATFTVIAALLPMAFVSGLMGPYMKPIPVGASAAMLFSLLVAFMVSPWLGLRLLRSAAHQAPHSGRPGAVQRRYAAVLQPLLDSAAKRRLVLAAIGGLLVLALLTIPLKGVEVKMLPFDNKSELQVIIDMPEDSTLEQTAALTKALGAYLKTVPQITDFQSYVGTASPYNFNGLVRHYFQRSDASSADIQVNFAAKSDRREQSHELAKRLRPELEKIGSAYRARLKVAEVPPGPPVLSTLVAEVYGPSQAGQLAVARQIRDIFRQTDGVVDVDWYVEEDQPKVWFDVDREKAAYHGLSTQAVASALQAAVSGSRIGLAHLPAEKEPVELFLRLPYVERAELTAASLEQLSLTGSNGALVPLSELVRQREGMEEKTIYHKNLKPVTYVIGDVAGKLESPVYAILAMKDKIAQVKTPEGYSIRQYSAESPWLGDTYAMKWDGEWQITYEVFRDMGVAFAAVLVLIYVLVVAWFKSFLTPLVIMAPIPLTLVGILPGHWLFGAFFTATSMIGFIALSGIIVRNSILLIDFAQASQREGKSLREALLAAGGVRFRPIVLTAAAVVVGSFVMLFDPIFQGLAIAMMFGAVAATGLTLLVVPLLFYEFFGRKSG
ncbi:efflux RND transporter permease subunit [Propionispora hippei]|uniref:Multidrug efflux pump subunit AcrB n=1 Tax=Propionispora hippei DSM 15287 TaxID=1123003 RepID=A0A1M6N0Z4_9FIRM|nr:efflux RND transporter permease subunit [Propionispora hippei]SHJ89328.1 Multidrug efflux pump subunit AcrB [Propionispora hippei DSM 15287]